jgi:hypothetical protein
MLSKSFGKVLGILLVSLAASTTASAQYGGGGGTGGTGPGGANSSGGYGSGNGKAIGIGVGVAAGAALGIGLLVHHHHAAARNQTSMIGCTESVLDGMTLKNEKDNLTYMIVSSGTTLQPGQRVELKDVAVDQSSGTHSFRVKSLVNNYGTCDSTTAALEKLAEQKTASEVGAN